MPSHLRPAVVLTALFIATTGLAYPLAVTGVAQLALPHQANGGLLADAGRRVIGSALLAQGFARPGYLHPRGSAAGASGYDATASSPSNLGPMDPKLAAAVKAASTTVRHEDGPGAIPADAVTQSGSGLDPDISPAYAALQAPRIARARGLALATVQAVIARNTGAPALGFIGQPHVNVLMANRALDGLATSSLAHP